MGLFSSLVWLPFLLLPLFLLFKKMIDRVNKELKNLPPSPPKLPIIGNLHQLGPLPHSSLRQLAREYGPVMLLHLGRIPVLIVSSADAAKELLKVNDLACCSRPRLASVGRLSYNYLDVAFSPYSEYWRELRKLCVLEIFSVKRVKSFRSLRADEVGSLMDSIARSASAFPTDPVNLTEKVFALSGSIIFRKAFGKSFRGSEFDRGKFYELVHDAETVAGAFSYAECFPGFGWILDWISGHSGRVERVFRKLDALFQQVIDEHLKPGRTNRGEDIIDVMLGIEKEQTEEHGHAWITKNHIKAILLNMFLGGIDTSALTVVWAMAELVRKPILMKKAQDEVREIVGKRGRVSETDLDQLQYLKLIIKETLRLHPPAPMLIARESISHFKIKGYNIYPKTLIQVNAWAIGRDPKYWENPEEFSPERFAGNAVDIKGQNFEYLPFGGGRRGCPGIYMGTVTSEFVLANLLYCFDWALPVGTEAADINMEEKAGHCLTLSKKTPLLLVPIKYLNGQASP
ncbi:cytochrome P450, family 71, subfamily B, polypeptide 36 [Hibiscus trionum]|uniref:Cytochrome P450, family 71, subfamily B, polypeptide 36 n=1 Tax=Hibiscus trionum TaxID=183268 RepID=A0A9W7MH34_HIBTR|nr:cytochrome P450, family 71, subfamily B, polypeptide 36 [Hibiscus trionum]